MSALVTDQFRILNTNNFISSIEDPSNAYYVFLGLSNPTAPGYGRTTGWDSSTPSPTDNFDYQNHKGGKTTLESFYKIRIPVFISK